MCVRAASSAIEIYELNINININCIEQVGRLTLRLKGKQPALSGSGRALISKSGVGHSSGPKTFSSRKHSVSIISFCHDMETDPVLNFV